MRSVRALRHIAASAFLVGLCACQGDDNTLPLPPDAGAADARADASIDASAPRGDAAAQDANVADVHDAAQPDANDASDGGPWDAAGPDENEGGGTGDAGGTDANDAGQTADDGDDSDTTDS